MVMDVVQDQEALLLANSSNSFKGKRTKRLRTMSSFLLSIPASSSSSGVEVSNYYYGGSGGGGSAPPHDHQHHRFTASPSDSGELAQSSVEEEDMANCLILLARGTNSQQQDASPRHPYVINKPAAAVGDVYQCKTCDRRFPSFQALGGHRASHKKPKAAVMNLFEEKNPAVGDHEITSSTVGLINNHVAASTTLSLQINAGRDSVSNNVNKSSRVHECSICGAEFSSGQALGGHMRRHRPLPITTVAASSSTNDSQDMKKQRALLSLDLNLPAPVPEEDCGGESKLSFTSKQEAMVFSSAPLVDCHY